MQFQSTLPREERRFLPVKEVISVLISIHAPTRGATSLYDDLMAELEFQSTLPREERLKRQQSESKIHYFNPRSHERSDRNLNHGARMLTISIHAPTRGATIYTGYSSHFSSISIHAPTRGATIRAATLQFGDENFNPRSHERSDRSRMDKLGVL